MNSNGGKPRPPTFRLPTEGELDAAAQTLAVAADMLAGYSTRIEALGSVDAADIVLDDAPTLRDVGLLFVYYRSFEGYLRAMRSCVEAVLEEALDDLAVVREDAALHRLAEAPEDHDQ